MSHFKKITDKLYQCLNDDFTCKHRLSFGLSKFCSWMLRAEEGRSENNFPCKEHGEKKPSD